ncbi:type II toxin-antitoxin system HipA family toxin YjjJ [Bdellovibrionota bacterium FG-1]
MVKKLDPRLLSILRAEGTQSPASLMARLGMSQSTLFRSVQAQPEILVALGGPRNRKLAALRRVRNLGSQLPVFQISAAGETVLLGNLLALHPHSFVFLSQSSPSRPQFYPGLPFFLDDMRPQGFLGRAFGHKHPDLKLPGRILDWGHDDILEAIARRGEDLTGNLLLGAESFDRHQAGRNQSVQSIDADHPEKQYITLAQAAMEGQLAGSSAGGEQPKFGAMIRCKGVFEKVLVKFSPAGDSFSAGRWRDLLICESLASEVLRDHGISSAKTRVLEGGGRTFLETIRFDRVGVQGRKGVLTLSAFENEWTGGGQNWAISAGILEREKKISSDDLMTIGTVECFGRLIANSDRHSGNLSFFWNPGDKQAVLAPVYDMLPMFYVPNSEGKDSGIIFSLSTYEHTLLSGWARALPMAIQFWQQVREDARISKKFRKTAAQNLKTVKDS